jgi:hypothetical protein
MPINRKQFYTDKAAAISFLCGQNGQWLHEVAHYVAGNFRGVLGGHLIVPENGPTAAFCFHDHYRERLIRDVQRFAFMCAAGAVAELYFCDNVGAHRLGRDIEMYCLSLKETDIGNDARDFVAVWRHNYRKRIKSLASCIEDNFDLCVELCKSKKYLLQGYHVIPTSVLAPPVTRRSLERATEIELTEPIAARQLVLARFILDRAGR